MSKESEVMTDKHRKYLYNEENSRERALSNNFSIWLTVAVMAIFIFLLFYSQKMQGTM